MKCKISHLLTSHIKCHHHLCIDLLYVLYIHKCILCILDHSVCMCYDFETRSLLAVRRAAVKDSRILNVCVRQLLKSVLFKHTQHMLKEECHIYC